jgi:hypothetical protein
MSSWNKRIKLPQEIEKTKIKLRMKRNHKFTELDSIFGFIE